MWYDRKQTIEISGDEFVWIGVSEVHGAESNSS